MPLSEHEQRILQEIEKHLYEEDPAFAGKVKRRVPRLSDADRAKMGALTFVLGFGILIAFFFLRSVFVGVLAFGAMVAGIVMVAGSLRRVAAEGRGQKDRLLRAFRDYEQRIRQRYKRR